MMDRTTQEFVVCPEPGCNVAFTLTMRPNIPMPGMTWQIVTRHDPDGTHWVGVEAVDEMERLRRIEAAARAYFDADWDRERAEAEATLREIWGN